MTEPDACLACYGGDFNALDGDATLGFCVACLQNGRAEIYLAGLAAQERDWKEVDELMAKARAKWIPGGMGS